MPLLVPYRFADSWANRWLNEVEHVFQHRIVTHLRPLLAQVSVRLVHPINHRLSSASPAEFCAARDADYKDLVNVIYECFDGDIANKILDFFDWSYDTEFCCTTKCLQTLDEQRTTTIRMSMFRDSSFLYHYVHTHHLKGNTEIDEKCFRGIYFIQESQLVLNGDMESSVYKSIMIVNNAIVHKLVTKAKENRILKFYRDDLFTYTKMRISFSSW